MMDPTARMVASSRAMRENAAREKQGTQANGDVMEAL